MAKVRSFDAVLERKPGRLGWTIVRIPFDAAKAWGRGMVKVRGEINGFAFRTSLFPDGKGGHSLLVNKKMQRGAGAAVGTKAHFRLEPDTAERVIEVPAELAKVLGRSKRLKKFYESSSNYSIRKWIADQVAACKAPATRARKAEQIAEWLMESMEAEQALPPLIERALAQEPQARRGWEQMTPAMRRGQLMGIFHCRNVDSRARRLAKTVQMAAEYAEKRSLRSG